MISPLVIGKVEKGKFVPSDKRKFAAAFACHEGKEVEFQPKRHRKTRSLNQNGYYWSVVVPMIADAMGEDDPKAVHEWLKAHFNYEVKSIGEKRVAVKVPRSTSDLNTSDFEVYLEKIRRWASEFFPLYIPLPNEVAF